MPFTREKKKKKLTGSNDQITPLPAKVLDRLAHNHLGLSRAVVLGIVEEVDAQVVRLLHAGKRLLVGRVPAVGHPAAEADGGDVEAGPAEAAVDHAGVSWFWEGHFAVCFMCVAFVGLRS